MTTKAIKLKALLDSAGLNAEAGKDVLIQGLSYDSRLTEKGDLFFAIKGAHADGHRFLNEVAEKGAPAAVVEEEAAAPIPLVKVPSVMIALSKIANTFFGKPSERIPVVGVTGTNGKTTTTYLIEDVVRKLGKECGVIGTVNYRLGKKNWPAPNTTPMSLDIQRFLTEAVENRLTAVVMEVSSHALSLHRVDDVQFKVGVFTNLTQDHLDFHGDMEAYFEAKASLFKRDGILSVVNTDDAYGRKLALRLPRAITFGFNPEASLFASQMVCDLKGVRFKIKFPSGRTHEIQNNLLGKHNVYNCLSTAGAALALGLSEDQIVQGLNQEHRIPGRLERVEQGQDFVVVVDYAHTHDALAQVLSTLRETRPKKLICVFGAGGDRDKTKRPKMGRVVAEMADYAFLTSDNPRSEDPQAILRDIEAGVKETAFTNYSVIEDREEAIQKAIQKASAGDIVLIAGKGHEAYQIYGRERRHFSDVEAAQKALSK